MDVEVVKFSVFTEFSIFDASSSINLNGENLSHGT